MGGKRQLKQMPSPRLSAYLGQDEPGDAVTAATCENRSEAGEEGARDGYPALSRAGKGVS